MASSALFYTNNLSLFLKHFKAKQKCSQIFQLSLTDFQNFLSGIFQLLTGHKTFPGVMQGPTKKCGPDWFRLFEFYWYTLNKQTNTKTSQKYTARRTIKITKSPKKH